MRRKLAIILFLLIACEKEINIPEKPKPIEMAALLIEGQTYTSVDVNWYGVDIPRTSPTALTFRNNSITAANHNQYLLVAGDETRVSTANNLDAAVITGNKFTWTLGGTTDSTHGIFVGFNKNDVIQYNYLDRVPYGAVIKSNGVSGTNMTNTSGGFCYNIVKDSNIGVRIKGMNGTCVYNNTFYNTLNANPPAIIYITRNADTGDGSPSINTKIKNNIFYSTNSVRFIYVESGCQSGFESDYNIFYCASGSPEFQLGGTVYQFNQWKSLGYDLHSIVINPNFINYTDFVPTTRLNYGTNLGSAYQLGLSTSAVWAVNSTPATTSQGTAWQVGARVYATTSSAHTYYVATTGSNSNAGTLASPWKDWYYGISQLVAGDTLYILPGTYTTMQGVGGGNYSGVNISAKNGTASLPITVSAYPGSARPVLDCSALSSIAGYHRGIRFVDSSYWNFYGLIIANVREYSGSPTTYTGSGWECQDISNVNIENCVVTGCMNGFSVSTHIVNLNYINCDAYDNWDIYQGGDLCNGFNGNANAGSTITYTGCRAWRNCDDGFDYLGGQGTITNTNCWSFNNGPWHGGDAAGNGCGFKLAQSSVGGGYRYMYNCISANNHSLGIEAQVDAGYAFTMFFYNNISANNGDYCGFRLPVYSQYGVSTARNNISYGNGTLYSGGAHNVVDHNNWNLSVTANNSDFVSVDIAQLSGTRNATGALPVITAFHLVSSSDLIDKGVNVGLPFTGTAPDLGAFEFSSTGNPAPGNIIKLGQFYGVGGLNFTLTAAMFLIDDTYTAPIGVRIPTTGTFVNCSRISQYVLLLTNPVSDGIFAFPIEYTINSTNWYTSSISSCVVYKSLPSTNISTTLIGTTIASAVRTVKNLCTSALVNIYSLYCPNGSAPYKMGDFKYYTHGAAGGTYVTHVAPLTVSTFNELYTIRGLCSRIFKEITNAPYSLSRVCIYKGSTWMASTEIDLTSVHGGYVDLIQQNTSTTPTVTTWSVKTEHFYGGAWVVESTDTFTITTDS